MKILYIDTTTSYLYTGLVIDGKLKSEIKEDFGKDLSSKALSKISEMLTNNHLEPVDIDKIMVVNGPGSFTGIRVGVTIAKTYAYSLNKDIVTVSSLEAMAVSSKGETSFKVPLIDARRNYVYAAIFNNKYLPILKQQYISLEALKCAVDHLIDSYQYISNQNFTDITTESYSPDIEKIVNVFASRPPENPHSINPIYLKQTEAEEKHKLEII
ncbi:MAG: tRNA (adenosine(37)-N6)-threonylcarbamoyltransferase complex dimerization subunit type 1 TsaB [Tenericutes bacterium]|nr:tRNA (adenosine(37)-N6)-threonylcarbamoyltransferase complex dimerization subunit type 1 TsaB [Mycoplasmatota bacterium]